MQDLITISNIITKQKIKDLNVFKTLNVQSNKQYQLYNGLTSGQIKSDSDALNLLYPNTQNHKNLLMVKYRLKQKLLNALFSIDINKAQFQDYSTSRISAFKNWSFVNILLKHSARKVAIEICEDAFYKAQKFGFTDLQILLGRILMRHYGYLDIKKIKHKFFENKVFEQLEVLKQELIAEKYYTEISRDYVKWKSSNYESLLEKLEIFCEELSTYEEQNKTYVICLHYYKLVVLKHLLKQEFTEAKTIALKGLNYFSSGEAKTSLAEFLFRQSVHICHMHLGEYDIAINLIKTNLSIAPKYKFNWFKEIGYYFGWSVVTKNYDEMVAVTSLATYNKNLIKFPRLYETWSIKESYAQIFIALSKIKETTLTANKLKRFKVNKFVNDVPKYSQDKRGLNVSILISHFIHLLIRKKYDSILNKIDSLKQYSHRYLRNNYTLRSNCFIKMLSKIPDSNYHPVALQRNTKKLKEKLINTKYNYTDNPTDIEVIPYETLWELVLEILTKNQKKIRA